MAVLPINMNPINTPFTDADVPEDDYFEVQVSQEVYWRPDPFHRRMLFILAFVVGMAALFVTKLPAVKENAPAVAVAEAAEAEVVAPASPALPASGISSVFTPEVQHWGPQITAWAAAYGLDPNIAATIMQIESCGDPQAMSGAGAQGLFQVMPFHFGAGEDMLDPDTNARRGLTYYVERLQQTGGDVGRAFAGYNGGQYAAGTTWDNWAAETQRYYVWSTGIYDEIQSGSAVSDTLQRWLSAGGASLCRQAAQRLGLTP